MIQVVNFKNRDSLPEPWFYIGRAMPFQQIHGSALGNPYKLTKGKSRDEVIAQYKAWLWKELANPDSEARAELYRLAARAREGDIYLACWCKEPGREVSCHGDVIKAAIEWINQQQG